MKRVILTLASVLLYSAAAFAQSMDFHVYSRLDASQSLPAANSDFKKKFNLGNSSLYLMTDGTITDRLSYDVSLNFLNRAPKGLYSKDTFFAPDKGTNFINWANLTFSLSDSWSISAGKQIAYMGGWEEDPYDVEQPLDLMSQDWNNINVYLWGASVDFSPNENSTFGLQITQSPLSGYMFAKNSPAKFAFNFNAQVGENDENTSIARFNHAQRKEAEGVWMLTLAHKYESDNFHAWLDFTDKWSSWKFNKVRNSNIVAALGYGFLDGELDFTLKGGYQQCNENGDYFGYGDEWNTSESLADGSVYGITPLGIARSKGYCFAGLIASYAPTSNFKFTSHIAWNNYTKLVSATIGILVNFDVHIFGRDE